MTAKAMMLAATAAVAMLAGLAPVSAATERVYIGTFTPDPGKKPQPGASAAGIYVADLDTTTGALSLPKLVAKSASPSWLIYDKARGTLFTTNEYDGYTDPKTHAVSGSVSVFGVDKASGALTPKGVTPVTTSTHIGLSTDRNWLIAMSWSDGVVSLLPVAADGKVGAVADTYKPVSTPRPGQAADQPRGNLLASDHAHSRMHGVFFHPGGHYAALDDAGQDTINIFAIENGKLKKIGVYPQMPGSAPRHSVWDAKGENLYTLFEQDGHVGVFGFDAKTGALKQRQRLAGLPAEFGGSEASAEILLSKDGKDIYTSNRFHDSISHFRVKADGTLTYVSDTFTGTNVPRGLALDPSGHFLLAGGQNNDSVSVFRIDEKTGEPKFTGHYAPVPSPASFAFVD